MIEAVYGPSLPSGTQAVSSTSVRSAAAAKPVEGADFGSVLTQAAANAVETMKAGEAAAIAGMQGRASVQQVVEAVMSAEQSLQSAVAIRDKVVSAYLELTRMAI